MINAGANVFGRSALFDAVQRSNNESEVQALIDAGADVNITDDLGQSALFYAVRQSNNESVVEALLNAGADVNRTDGDGQSALFYAVLQSNNESVVQALLNAGADVNRTDGDGQSALFDAVRQSNNESVVQALLNADADVNRTDGLERTALFDAVQQSNNESVVQALLNAGADVNITDGFDQTALSYALRQSNNESVVQALLNAGADVNRTDRLGRTALFHAVQQSNNESVVEALLNAGADVNRTDGDGQSALFYAVRQSNNESVVQALLNAGADVNRTDRLGRTALFYAVRQSNNESVVEALRNAGADVNRTDGDGQSALFYAVRQSNNESVVRTLIDDGGASVSVRDLYGRTPLFYSIDYVTSARILAEKEMEQYLNIKDNCNCSALSVLVEKHLFHDAGIKGRVSEDVLATCLKFLKECEAQKTKPIAEVILNLVFCKFPLIFASSQPRWDDLQPFGFTAKSYFTEITIALKLASEFVNDQRKQEILQLIGMLNKKCTEGEALSEALQLLVELGADPNSADSDGNTALHYAACLPSIGVPQEIVMEICLQLEKLGVRFDMRSHKKETPLLFALPCYMGSLDYKQMSSVKTLVEMCRFLSKHGYGFEERSRSGKTVFHVMFMLLREGLMMGERSLRQDILHEAMNLLQLFSPRKLVKTRIVNIPDADLLSPLDLWASLRLPSPQDYTTSVTKDLTFEQFLRELLNYLLRCGAMLNSRNYYDQTPLHFCRTWTAVKLLLAAGAKANDIDSSGESPLLAAAKRRHQGFLYPDTSEFEDPKSFWETAIDKGLDPWTDDNEGQSVLSILIKHDKFVLAKALVDVACEKKYTQSETFAVGLLNAICKDESPKTNWKSNLVKDILKSRKIPPNLSEPMDHCCRNLVAGILEIKEEEDGSDDNKDDDDGQPQSKKRRKESATLSTQKEIQMLLSVHCENIKILCSYGSNVNSFLGMASISDAIKEILRKLADETVSDLIPWTSLSEKYKVKLAKVARRQECYVIHGGFWCHKEHTGSGSFGHVFIGINEKDGREVAVKRIEKLRMQRPEDKREITNLIALADCEQIVRYLCFFEEENFSYIVLELMEGNLDEYLTDGSTFNARKSTQLCQDVVRGLKFLHEQNIIHRDLKPGNILYKTHPHLRLKIADFGLSRRIDSSTTPTVYGTNAGTRCWMAPEVLMGVPDHSKASDMFSCGLVLHYILSVQKHPFSKNNSQMAHQIETNITDGRMEGWDCNLSPEATHLVKNMLGGEKKNRPNAAEALLHPLFWSNAKKVDFLIAVGNQTVFEYPRAGKLTCLSAVKTDLEKNFSTIVVHGKWNDPRYKDMPTIYKQMTSTKRKYYDTHSVVELVRFIRNAHAHVSEATRPTPFQKMLLEDFVFLEYFPHLVMKVYKVVIDHGWDGTVEEIKYAMNK